MTPLDFRLRGNDGESWLLRPRARRLIRDHPATAISWSPRGSSDFVIHDHERLVVTRGTFVVVTPAEAGAQWRDAGFDARRGVRTLAGMTTYAVVPHRREPSVVNVERERSGADGFRLHGNDEDEREAVVAKYRKAIVVVRWKSMRSRK